MEPTRSLLAADQIAALVEAYRSGKTVKELASEFGIHRTTVSSHLNEHGVPVRRGGLDQERAAEAVRLYDEGWSSGRLGERLGVSADTCSQSSAGPEHRSGPDAAGHPA